MKKIKRLFIANRGEIARRIALAAKAHGCDSFCISEVDTIPDYLQGLITDTIKVDEESPAVYLDQDLMISFAKQVDADAIHPGFGFLSENADFAQKVTEAGLIWVGPNAKAISAMASKAAARDLATSASVPCVPGIQNLTAESNIDQVRNFAETYGFPILIKAALGGGGKGMRVVREMTEIEENMARAGSEALNSFGDSNLIVERFLENPRHVEVQILGDQQGNVLAVGDRDCSVQRRHQKIIEESPAPFIHEITRKKMHEAAVNLAKQVGYYSAGTVEYLLEGADDSEEQNFYFLEMNTRLQVEHPVTEEVHGCDLVRWQLRVAEGENIEHIRTEPMGHSVEARIYAEDPAKDFMPSPGKIHCFVPYVGEGIRWEIGLDTIDEVSGKFDPMIAKVIATGTNRHDALSKLAKAIDKTIMNGPDNNMNLLSAICRDERFRSIIDGTRYIADNLDGLQRGIESQKLRYDPISKDAFNFLSRKGPRQVHTDTTSRVFQETSALIQSTTQDTYLSKVYEGQIVSFGNGSYQNQGGLIPFLWSMTQTPSGTEYYCNIEGTTFRKQLARGASAGNRDADNQDAIIAPVPGKLIKLLIEPGSEVQEKSTVLILESMKMEFEVKAPRNGVVDAIHFAEGSQVDPDNVIVTLQKQS